MASESIKRRLAAKAEAQKQLRLEEVALRRALARQEKKEHERVARHIGRLALNCGLGGYEDDQLITRFQMVAKDLESKVTPPTMTREWVHHNSETAE